MNTAPPISFNLSTKSNNNPTVFSNQTVGLCSSSLTFDIA